jgi:hypothetical protein
MPAAAAPFPSALGQVCRDAGSTGLFAMPASASRAGPDLIGPPARWPDTAT